MGVPLGWNQLIYSAPFKIVSLIFAILIILCLDIDFFGFIFFWDSLCFLDLDMYFLSQIKTKKQEVKLQTKVTFLFTFINDNSVIFTKTFIFHMASGYSLVSFHCNLKGLPLAFLAELAQQSQVVTKFLSFCLFENVLISSSLLKDKLTCYKTVG